MADRRAEWMGNKLLEEIEEASLNKILTTLRAQVTAITLHHHNQQQQQYRQANAATWDDHANPEPICHPNQISTSIPRVPGRKHLPIPGLDELSLRHQKSTGQGQGGPVLSVSGRYLALVYKLVAALLAPPLGKAVVVVDAEGRFEARRVLLAAAGPGRRQAGHTGRRRNEDDERGKEDEDEEEEAVLPRIEKEDLKHLYVYKPARDELKATLDGVEEYMLYGAHGSGGREWWGTIVIGGTGAGEGDVACGWKGWLRVEREGGVRGFGDGPGLSVQEALRLREERQRMVDERGTRWWGRSAVGDVRLS